MKPRRVLAIFAAVCVGVHAAPTATAPTPATLVGHVHSRSALSRRAAPWTRTQCGNLGSSADIPTKWAADVIPDALPAYPRPQLTRSNASWVPLDGLWEFQLAAPGEAPPFGRTLNQTILVPFPLESCLSGAFRWPAYSQHLWYRLLFDAPAGFPAGSSTTLLHFGAVDWQASVFLNGVLVGGHVGGYSGFSFDVSAELVQADNELIVGVYDPTDSGYQPEGKQWVGAIGHPSSVMYTPSSGVWQTVWLEGVPAYHITDLAVGSIGGDGAAAAAITLRATASQPGVPGALRARLTFNGTLVAAGTGAPGEEMRLPVSPEHLHTWHPDHPYLYDLAVELSAIDAVGGGEGSVSDSVGSYAGLRSYSLKAGTTPPAPASGPRVGWDTYGPDLPGQPSALPADAGPDACEALCVATTECGAYSFGVPSCGGGGPAPLCWLKSAAGAWVTNPCRAAGKMGTPAAPVLRPALNGNFSFLLGWLDQSWWPDGAYAAPTDEALRSDLVAAKVLGFNSVRVHQKVNPERWYYWADVLGVAVIQDAPQKYLSGASAQTVAPFLADLSAMVSDRGSHPSILQWTVFNEDDCYAVFPDIPAVVAWLQEEDPSRLVDADSGGKANNLGVGNVWDIHTYPWPAVPAPLNASVQIGMVGEFGGIGAFVSGHEWSPGGCFAYATMASPAEQAATYVNMTAGLRWSRASVSIAVVTQATDTENECDGFLTMDRLSKFSAQDAAAIAAVNRALIRGDV